MKVKVLIPFYSKAVKKDCEPNDVIEVTEKQLVEIRAVNINMVEVVEEKPKKKAKAEK